jgi:hypothetical protein
VALGPVGRPRDFAHTMGRRFIKGLDLGRDLCPETGYADGLFATWQPVKKRPFQSGTQRRSTSSSYLSESGPIRRPQFELRPPVIAPRPNGVLRPQCHQPSFRESDGSLFSRVSLFSLLMDGFVLRRTPGPRPAHFPNAAISCGSRPRVAHCS